MYYSQEGQDKFLDTQIFKGSRNHVFVDIGAHNGVTISNSLFFEQTRNWTGLLVEPLPDVFEELVRNRPNTPAERCAVSEVEGNVQFLKVSGYSEMTSGIVDHYDPRHRMRIQNEVRTMGGDSTIINVPSYRLSSLLEKHGLSHVHYLSIDVEGSEFSVLKSIDFSKVFIDVIGFENNYNDVSEPIVRYLQEKGYRRIPCSGVDIFMIHKDSQFRQ